MDEGSGTIAYDYSGYGNNGTLYSGSTVCSNPPTSGCPTWIDGKFGKALSFDGVDDYVEVPYSASLNPSEFSISVWARVDGGQGTWRSVITSRDAATFRGYIIYAGVDNKWQFWIGDSTAWIPLYGPDVILGQWIHIVATYSGGVMRLYINGSLYSTRSGTLALNTIRPLRIGAGRTETTPGYFFNGIIDEVRIYNRALSDEEIKELYYNGLTNKFNITIGLLNLGFADLGKSFTAIVYLKNGTILQLPLVLNRDLTKGSYLENNLTIDGYYPSYGLVDKIMVCSNDCQGVCSEISVNNQC
jgi:hypothetical protein